MLIDTLLDIDGDSMDNNTAATQDLSDNETPVPGVDTSAIRRVSLLSLRLIILDLTNSFQLLKIIRVFLLGPSAPSSLGSYREPHILRFQSKWQST